MNKFLKNNLLIATLLFLISGCKTQTGDNREQSFPYSPHIEAFTSGKISRYSQVYLIFNEEIPVEKMKEKDIHKHIHFKPDVKGEFELENNRTIVFKPTNGFQRNTTYQVTADLSEWIEISPKEKNFIFDFTTFPLALRVNPESMDISDIHPGHFDISFTIVTPDREAAEEIEPLIKISEQQETVWQHTPDGKRHQLLLKNVAGEKGNTRTLSLSVAPNKLKIPEENLISIQIPDVNNLSVYSVELFTEPERYVEVTFTQPLDDTQSMEGLAWIENNSSAIVDVEGNKLRLYPDANKKGDLTIHLDREIRSKTGSRLNEKIIRTITVTENLPKIEFIGSGVIIPQSTELIVPFRAVYLRGVVARVIRISEQNIGHFLQINQLNGSNELLRTGRLVARKTIFLDEDESLDLSDWNNFAIDLKQLLDPEPGAIYRIELDFNKDLSVYPCDEETKPSKEQLLAQDEVKFREEVSKFDEGGYYYSWHDYNYWWNYDYEQRNNPCSGSYYINNNVGKNVLASNLGLVAKRGQDDEVMILVHNIQTTYPEKGVEISVYNYQNGLLGKAVTNESGIASIQLSSGKPFYVIAKQGRQRSYLRIDDGSALSVSTFDVAGDVVQKGIKGFIYGERGVWRPGDTLHLGFMLNDREKKLPDNHPVIMELINPLGQSYLRKTQTRNELGLYTFNMPTDPDAPTGAWSVNVSVGGVSFYKRLRIETIKPNRLKIDFKLPESTLLRSENVKGEMHVEWLQGAIARNLKYEIEGTFISTPTTFSGYPGFQFDDPSKTFKTEDTPVLYGAIDDKGDATIPMRFESGSAAPGMLLANFVTRVFEESGDFSIDAMRALYSPYRRYTGIRSPQIDRKQLDTGKDHEYEIVVVDYTGKPVTNTEVDIEVYRVNWYWWWDSNQSGLANYVSNSNYLPVKKLTVKTNGQGKASFNLNFSREEWGSYYIHAKDKEGDHSIGVLSYFDWPEMEGRREAEGNSSANTITIQTDKKEYAPGEKMIVTIPSSEASRAVISIENGTKVLQVSEHYCKEGETQIPIEIKEEMQPNIYVNVTVLQPHAYTENDLPVRQYGIIPVIVTSPHSHLHPVIKTADEYKPESPYEITVSEKDGRPMAYTLAIVDEGLLDLTRFQTPDPWRAFNAREALGVTSWDLYNYIVGAYGGRLEQIFSIGGDDALDKGPKATANRFIPVVQFDGPFLLKKGEKRQHSYTMPNYNGRVRVMVVAGNGQAYGNTEKSVMVRKPVMLLGTLPRVIGIGEEMAIPATVFATEKGVGDVTVSIACSDNMEIIGAGTQNLYFTEPEDKQAMFRIRVKNNAGIGKVILTATGKGDKAVYETEIEIRSVRRPQVKVTGITLEAGKVWEQNLSLPGAPGTNKLTLEVSDVPPVNLTSRLSYLIGYPHGCIEQITSKGFPQLYLKQFASLTKEQEIMTEQVIKGVVSKMRSYQTADGAFTYWPGRTSSDSWATIYATHFLLEAEGKGYMVPESMKRSVLNHLKKTAREWRPVENYYTRSEEMIQAYRLYTLALGQMSEIGAMNRLKENDKLSVTSRWMLASAYTLIGRADVANSLINKTTDVSENYTSYDLTYGSNLRDKAIRLQTLSLLEKEPEATELVKDISNSLSSENWYSTQTTAFTLISLSQYMNRYHISDNIQFKYESGKSSETINTDKNIWSETLVENGPSSAPVKVENTGQSTLFLRAIMEGTPDQGEENAYANEIGLEVKYVDTYGRPIQVNEMEQGVNFAAIVTVKNPTATIKRNLVLTQIFPAGWEILNTRFLHEETARPETAGISYQDIRDDRVYSYMDVLNPGRHVTVRINLCTVYPGKFYLPPIYCEAMYDHLTRANTEGQTIEIN